ncbi:sec-independent protein translocase protein TatB [Isoptericola sp. CG 20/1183]|uniref:Sec-independent protein translocase protein TatB n=1 Tax=Isoptericola halotolerans TaxID=300560 RepID=A0ABX5EF14_9MICO|nr:MULTISPECIES: twin-arginine translocase TatA/TatE family subunit [Isoptericola]MCK0116888.1 twin-arginine translocase TatA/TatE family subunit [Isoptericola sp. S6320L]PRZ07737.1 sec-independent protein translocase protein TatB [Isoptericola halotolerans]PRZ07904.1 sec-independent protein translocase protein TatB [Isoptericola sp. CG 20/1183]
MGFFGINGGELVVIIVLALVLIGPERLPHYAGQLGTLVRQGKAALQGAKERIDDEFGDELKDVDWQKLDPRQYDPRRIVKEALLDDEPAPRTTRRTAGYAGTGSAAATAAGVGAAPSRTAAAEPAPFDDEAT